MKLTEEEKELIIKHRKKEEAKKPKKIGFLKEDLYKVEDLEYYIYERFFSTSEKEQLIEHFKSNIKLVLSKGSKFVCYIRNDQEQWFDDHNCGIEYMSEEWAAKYLNIQGLKKND